MLIICIWAFLNVLFIHASPICPSSTCTMLGNEEVKLLQRVLPVSALVISVCSILESGGKDGGISLDWFCCPISVFGSCGAGAGRQGVLVSAAPWSTR